MLWTSKMMPIIEEQIQGKTQKKIKTTLKYIKWRLFPKNIYHAAWLILPYVNHEKLQLEQHQNCSIGDLYVMTSRCRKSLFDERQGESSVNIHPLSLYPCISHGALCACLISLMHCYKQSLAAPKDMSQWSMKWVGSLRSQVQIPAEARNTR